MPNDSEPDDLWPTEVLNLIAGFPLNYRDAVKTLYRLGYVRGARHARSAAKAVVAAPPADVAKSVCDPDEHC